MEVQPGALDLTSNPYPQPMGISAQLADARAQLRAATPPAAWEAVLDEVQKVRNERSVSLLAAMRIVYGKLAAGWLPVARPRSRGDGGR